MLPETLSINAWTAGDTQPALLSSEAIHWGIGGKRRSFAFLAGKEIDFRDWRDPDVGWGLLLPENEGKTEAERAMAVDAPKPIQRLLRARQPAPVFRYRPDVEDGYLRRYYKDAGRQDISVFGKRGVARGRFPHYLLIVGSPKEIPWRVQYFLNQPCYVGRLDLEDEGLDNYVSALLNDWQDCYCSPSRPVVWSVDHGVSDITRLMRKVIGEPLRDELEGDPQIEARFLSDEEATVTNLVTELGRDQPALIVTTSHGMIGPLDDLKQATSQLGLPVDHNYEVLSTEMLNGWSPNGAIWYAHACCSAGGDDENRYQDLVASGSSVETVLASVASIGAQVSPLPKALLGAKKPLRAFIGQVEPTFDWTLRAPTGQALTDSLIKAIYPALHLRRPSTIGLAFERYHFGVGTLFRKLEGLQMSVGKQNGVRTRAVDTRLTALDRESLVIIGDPTVAPQALPLD